MLKVQKTSNNQLILTIPKKIAEFKDIDKGTVVLLKDHTKDTILIKIIRKGKEEKSKK